MRGNEATFRLGHVLTAIERIGCYTEGMSSIEFRQDSKVADASLLNLSIIGRAASYTPARFRSQHVEIPWSDIDRLYNLVEPPHPDIDLDRAWQMIRDDLPAIEKAIRNALDSDADGS